MKDWILKTFFKDYQIQAFKLAHADILETLADDLEARAQALSQEKLAGLLSIVDPSKILTVESRSRAILIGGELANDILLSNLRAEAQFFQASELWNLIVQTNRRLAEKAMFEADGDVNVQLLKGRAILYTLDTQIKTIELLSNLSPHG